MVDAWTWIDQYIPLGILALGLSMTLVPFLFYLSTEVTSEKWQGRLFGCGVWMILVCFWLGIGGSYIMTR